MNAEKKSEEKFTNENEKIIVEKVYKKGFEEFRNDSLKEIYSQIDDFNTGGKEQIQKIKKKKGSTDSDVDEAKIAIALSNQEVEKIKKEIEDLDRALGSGEVFNEFASLKKGTEGYEDYDYGKPHDWVQNEILKREKKISKIENKQNIFKISKLKKEIDELNRALGGGEVFNEFAKFKKDTEGYDDYDFKNPHEWVKNEIVKREKKIHELEGLGLKKKNTANDHNTKVDNTTEIQQPIVNKEKTEIIDNFSKEYQDIIDDYKGEDGRKIMLENLLKRLDYASSLSNEDEELKLRIINDLDDIEDGEKSQVVSPDKTEPKEPEREPIATSLMPDKTYRYMASYLKVKERNENVNTEEIDGFVRWCEDSDANRQELASELNEMMNILSNAENTDESINEVLKSLAKKVGIPVENDLYVRAGEGQGAHLEESNNNIGSVGLRSILESQVNALRTEAEARVYQQGRLRRLAVTVGKVLGYSSATVAVGFATGGIGAFTALGAGSIGVLRVLEKYRSGRADENSVATELEAVRNEVSTSESRRNQIISEMMAQISILKQNQVAVRDEENSGIDEIIINQEEECINNNDNLLQVELLRDQREVINSNLAMEYLNQNRNFDSLSNEEKIAFIQRANGLYREDEKLSLDERQITHRTENRNIFRRAVSATERFFGNRFLRGGRTAVEKTGTAAVFIGAGMVAREIPVIRNILMGFGGMKTGELIANLSTSTLPRYRILRQLTHRSIQQDALAETVNSARTQLLDQDFRANNPIEYARLRAALDNYEQSALRDANQISEYLDNRNQQIDNNFAEKTRISNERSTVRTGAQIFGAVAGASLGADAVNSAVNFFRHKETIDLNQPINKTNTIEEVDLRVKDISNSTKDIDIAGKKEFLDNDFHDKHITYNDEKVDAYSTGRLEGDTDNLDKVDPRTKDILDPDKSKNVISEKDHPSRYDARRSEIGARSATYEGMGITAPASGEAEIDTGNLEKVDPRGIDFRDSYLDVKIEGKINTYSDALRMALKQADSETQDNCIRRYLDENTEINDENRQSLLAQTVRKLSISNTNGGPDVKNLIYEGNVGRLKQDGTFEILKGESAYVPQAVKEAELRANAERLRISEEKIQDTKTEVSEVEAQKEVQKPFSGFNVKPEIRPEHIVDLRNNETLEQTGFQENMTDNVVEQEMMQERKDYLLDNGVSEKLYNKMGESLKNDYTEFLYKYRDITEMPQIIDALPEGIKNDAEASFAYLKVIAGDSNEKGEGLRKLFNLKNTPAEGYGYKYNPEKNLFEIPNNNIGGREGAVILLDKQNDKIGVQIAGGESWGLKPRKFWQMLNPGEAGTELSSENLENLSVFLDKYNRTPPVEGR